MTCNVALLGTGLSIFIIYMKIYEEYKFTTEMNEGNATFVEEMGPLKF